MPQLMCAVVVSSNSTVSFLSMKLQRTNMIGASKWSIYVRKRNKESLDLILQRKRLKEDISELYGLGKVVDKVHIELLFPKSCSSKDEGYSVRPV